jgi:hypothetical protein
MLISNATCLKPQQKENADCDGQQGEPSMCMGSGVCVRDKCVQCSACMSLVSHGVLDAHQDRHPLAVQCEAIGVRSECAQLTLTARTRFFHRLPTLDTATERGNLLSRTRPGCAVPRQWAQCQSRCLCIGVCVIFSKEEVHLGRRMGWW